MNEDWSRQLVGLDVVVTGAGRGLGAALALTLSDLGCNVVLCARSLEGLESVASHVELRIGRCPVQVPLDLADAAGVDAAAREIRLRCPKVDVLIHNGATWLEKRDGPYLASEVLSVVGSAIAGTFLLTQALLSSLRQSTRPDVVTIGSISALPNASLHTASVPFYAAKRGQSAVADGLREMLWGTPIRSICIHPPWLTDVSPLDEA